MSQLSAGALGRDRKKDTELTKTQKAFETVLSANPLSEAMY